jgi:hypothetical protein
MRQAWDLKSTKDGHHGSADFSPAVLQQKDGQEQDEQVVGIYCQDDFTYE